MENETTETRKIETLKFIGIAFAALGLTHVILNLTAYFMHEYRGKHYGLKVADVAPPIMISLLTAYFYKVPRFNRLLFYANVMGLAFYGAAMIANQL